MNFKTIDNRLRRLEQKHVQLDLLLFIESTDDNGTIILLNLPNRRLEHTLYNSRDIELANATFEPYIELKQVNADHRPIIEQISDNNIEIYTPHNIVCFVGDVGDIDD